MSGTVHQLGEHRSARQPLRALSIGAEAAECELLAERAAALLAAAEEAVAARGRYRPGIAALAGEISGLTAAIEALCTRQLAVAALWDDGFARGSHTRLTAPARAPRPPRPRLLPGGGA